jgi:methylphosphotriester-DNA--protein-cysteine methyltransferase
MDELPFRVQKKMNEMKDLSVIIGDNSFWKAIKKAGGLCRPACCAQV